MKYVQINTFSNGSTGSIMMGLHEGLLSKGDESYVAYARGREAKGPNEIKIGSKFDVYVHGIRSRITGKVGFYSKRATRKLLKRLDEINPDVVHLHNLHGYYINIEMLFDWLTEHECQVKWTFHDCWAFTGHCAHFTYVGCNQWETGCASCLKCPQLKEYPRTFAGSRSASWNYSQKKRLFTSLSPERMTLISPSRWLADLVGKSFLGSYSTMVVHNKIDQCVFRPAPSDFRERYGLENAFIILGVASVWTERKGLSDFIQLSRVLDESSRIVLVGLDKNQIKKMPSNIIGIEKTSNKKELAEIYTAADVFFNPTHEDNYPTVNLEAQACGTRVATYDVGGCVETLTTMDSRCIDSDLNIERISLILREQ